MSAGHFEAGDLDNGHSFDWSDEKPTEHDYEQTVQQFEILEKIYELSQRADQAILQYSDDSIANDIVVRNGNASMRRKLVMKSVNSFQMLDDPSNTYQYTFRTGLDRGSYVFCWELGQMQIYDEKEVLWGTEDGKLPVTPADIEQHFPSRMPEPIRSIRPSFLRHILGKLK